MAAIANSGVRNLSRNLRISPSTLNCSYSTSLFPSILKDVFSTPLHGAAVAKTEDVKISQKIDISKKAKRMIRLINSNPWSAELGSTISALLPISQTAYFQIIRRIKNPMRAYCFFKLTKDSGFAHNHQSYFMMLEILGQSKNLNTARNFLFSIPTQTNNAIHLTDKLFNSLIRSYGNAGLFQESMKLFKVMKSMAVSPSSITFNSLLLILFKRGKIRMAYQVYDEMLRTYYVKPDLYTFNVMIKGLCSNSRIDIAFRLFREMDACDFEPDLATYNTLVNGLCKAGKVDIADNLVKGMLKRNGDLKPNVVTYTTLLRGYCAKQEIEKALDLLGNMIDTGVQPNNITYNVMIQGLCESQNLSMIKEVFGQDDEVEKVGFVPDTCTFNTLMNALCSRKNIDEALKIFEKMKELHVEHDSATFSILVRALCQNGEFSKAEKLLDELVEKEILLRNDNCKPLSVAYNPIFEHLCSNGKTKKADKVLRQLMKRGVQDPHAFEIIISGHCKEGKFVEGHELLVLMVRRYFKPNLQTYISLIEGLLLKKKALLALDCLLKMLKNEYLPRASIYHNVLTELIRTNSPRKSADLMMLMLEKDIRLNINLSTEVIELMFRSFLKKEALQLVQSIYAKGYLVNVDKVVSFLCKEKKLLQAYELLIYLLTNDENVEISICNAVLTRLCGAKMFSEAFELYYELLEIDAQGAFECLGDLRTGLDSIGKVKQAEFVAKRIISS